MRRALVASAGVLAVFATGLIGTTPAGATSGDPASPWEDGVVYVLIPDKFADGGVPNTRYPAGSRGGYRGGDLPGAIAHANHLDLLPGVDTALVYPVFDNTEQAVPLLQDDAEGNPIQYQAAGYSVRDFTRVEEDLGTTADYGRLVDELHRRDIRVIQDIPFAILTALPRSDAPWRAQASTLFRRWDPAGELANAGTPERLPSRTGPEYDSLFAMIAVDHERNRDQVNQQMAYPFTNQFPIDGYRYDSAQAFRFGFWPTYLEQFRARPGFDDFVQVGEFVPPYGPQETYNGTRAEYVQPSERSGGRPMFDSIYDVELMHHLRAVFSGRAEPDDLAAGWASSSTHFGTSATRQMLAIDNYENTADLPESTFRRLVADPAETDARELSALTFLLTSDRVPLLYSGNEYGIDYGDDGSTYGVGALFDPAVVRARQPFADRVFWLLALRDHEPALRSGDLAWVAEDDPDLVAYTRTLGDDRLLVTHDLAPEPGEPTVIPLAQQGLVCADPAPLRFTTDTAAPTAQRTHHGLVLEVPQNGLTSQVLSCPAYPASGFEDVAGADASIVDWAVGEGIVNRGARFRPDETITRQAAVQWLWRLAGRPQARTRHRFDDVSPSTEAALRWAVARGIVTQPVRRGADFNGAAPVQPQTLERWLQRYVGEPVEAPGVTRVELLRWIFTAESQL